MATAKKIKLPTNPGDLADRYHELRERRLAIDRLAAEAKALETSCYEALKVALNKAGLTSAGGKHHCATLVSKRVANVKDWEAFYGYIKKHNAFELLQRRPSMKAIEERWDAKKEIPGVAAEVITELSITKL